MKPILRLLLGLLCLALGAGCAWLALSLRADWAFSFMLWAWAFFFLTGTYASWFYPWASQLSAASKKITAAELTADADGGFIEIGRHSRFLAMTRKCGVLVDGVKVGELGVEERLRVRVSTGEHRVQARLSWVVSAPHVVIVRRGETVSASFALPRLSEMDRAILGPFQGSLYFQWR